MALSVDNYRKRGRERPINDLSGGLAGAVWTVAEVDRRRGDEVEAADTELESGRLEDAHVAREHVVGVHQNRAEVAQLNNTIDTYLYDIQYTRQHNKTVHTPRLTALCPGLPRSAGTRKVKPILILLKQETVSGNGISWAICKSAPRFRQIQTQAHG